MKNLARLKRVDHKASLQIKGKVTKIVGLTIEADGPLLGIGTRCSIESMDGRRILAEIVGFKDDRIILMPYGESEGIAPGSHVTNESYGNTVKVSDSLLGRVLDGLGNPMDGKGPITDFELVNVYQSPPQALEREIIKTPVSTGIKAIDNLITIGRGQRVGIFAGSGVGKSVTLGMIARDSDADVNVIALIGERGREVREFIERDLGEEGLKRSVLVIATSDQSALIRKLGAFVGTAIAEYFRSKGLNVMLMMDSVTRFAMAQREIGLTVGEPPTTKGYTPSVFGLLPKLLERAGTQKGKGNITGLYTVLVEADDMNDPIGDSVRSIIDGHIVLSRGLAAKNHYPAIDVLSSASRLMKEIVNDKQYANAGRMRDLLASYNEAEDLINIGAYVKGSNPKIDESIAKIGQIEQFLRQGIDDSINFEESTKLLDAIIAK
ncbi:flagellar protein export ATPase FliI [Denitrovibrio acetiphilus DSM 12809]|uniref:Flagellar protein export ATPase FliI n=1 Tax=Denitrovibrio acetiphilus (strain DSM 12809 / NBRC 114555 / N2460) TaxID=522772 RepID=D4H350_DENA2|nr:flagellar protein export ATPase FliI [Denitrovibrio acetiphilus]ADD69073.1 flagellar protein export ATPase FliI [Denitrovibrio acetiphilus DSM 12809]